MQTPVTSKSRMEPRVSFRVRPEVLEELRALAEAQELPVGALVRRALRLLLADEAHRSEKRVTR